MIFAVTAAQVCVQIGELFEDLRDGVNLTLLLEVLTNRVLVRIVSFALL